MKLQKLKIKATTDIVKQITTYAVVILLTCFTIGCDVQKKKSAADTASTEEVATSPAPSAAGGDAKLKTLQAQLAKAKKDAATGAAAASAQVKALQAQLTAQDGTGAADAGATGNGASTPSTTKKSTPDTPGATGADGSSMTFAAQVEIPTDARWQANPMGCESGKIASTGTTDPEIEAALHGPITSGAVVIENLSSRVVRCEIVDILGSGCSVNLVIMDAAGQVLERRSVEFQSMPLCINHLEYIQNSNPLFQTLTLAPGQRADFSN